MPQDTAELDEGTGQITDPMKREGADHEIELPFAERYQLGIGSDRDAAASFEKHERGIHCNDPFDPRLPSDSTGQCAVVCAEIEYGSELSFGAVEALDQPVGDLGMQEVDAAGSCCPVAMQTPGAAIEYCDQVGGHHEGGLTTSCRLRVDERACSQMMGPDAGISNLHGQDRQSVAAARPRRR